MCSEPSCGVSMSARAAKRSTHPKTTKNGPMSEKNSANNLPVPITSLALEQMDVAAVANALAESGIDGLSPFDLDKISMPGAGGLTWNVPTEEGVRPKEAIEGIILHQHPTRQLYEGAYDAANPSPPRCASYDGVTGHGDPGGSCAVCPLGQFGGPCKPYRFLYVLFPDKTVPTLLILPRTSLSRRLPKGFAKYVSKLAFRGKVPAQMVSRISLEQRKQGMGSVAVFDEGAALSPEHYALVREYATAFKGALGFPSAPGPVVDPTKDVEIGVDDDDDDIPGL